MKVFIFLMLTSGVASAANVGTWQLQKCSSSGCKPVPHLRLWENKIYCDRVAAGLGPNYKCVRV